MDRGSQDNPGTREIAPAADTGRVLAETESPTQVARALAEIQGSLMWAAKYPRDETRARAELQKAVERFEFADAAHYSFPRAGKDITGPSINFAREWARLWRNIIYGYRIVADTDGQRTPRDPGERTIEAYAWDIETNVRTTAYDTFKKLIQRKVIDPDDPNRKRRITAWVVPDERDLREVTERHAAIQMRNCLLRLAPRDLIDEMLSKALETFANKAGGANLASLRTQCLRSFEEAGVTQDMLESRLGHSMDKTTGKELGELRGIWSALKDGAATVDHYFGDGADAHDPEPSQESKAKIEADREAARVRAEQNGQKEGARADRVRRTKSPF